MELCPAYRAYCRGVCCDGLVSGPAERIVEVFVVMELCPAYRAYCPRVCYDGIVSGLPSVLSFEV